MPETTLSNKRIVKNTLFLYIRMLLIMGISLYTSRVVLDKLGVEDYGIYSLVGSFITIFSFISGPMIAATQRFLNFSLGKNDIAETQKVFNASLVIHIGIALLVIILAETVGLWFLKNRMIIPENRIDAAFWTYQYAVISTSFLVITYPYNATIIAHEKMKTFAYVSVLDATLRLAVVFLLTLSPNDDLIFYAFLTMVVQIIIAVIYFIYCRLNFTETKLRIKDIGSKLYKDIISFSGWNLLGNIANVCLTQGRNILLNIFFGPTLNTPKGLATQVQGAVNQLCTNFQTAQNPQIVKSYAIGETDYMKELVYRSSKISFYLTFILALPILMKTNFILSIWLKDIPDYTTPFIQYSMLLSLIQALAGPLITGSMATGDVKKIMSVIAIFFWAIIPLGYIVLKMGGSPVSIFVVQLILFIIAHYMRIRIVGKQLNFSLKQYFHKVLLPISKVTFIATIIALFFKDYTKDSLLNILGYFVIIESMLIALIWFLGISSTEKTAICNFIKFKLKKKE